MLGASYRSVAYSSVAKRFEPDSVRDKTRSNFTEPSSNGMLSISSPGRAKADGGVFWSMNMT